MGKLMKALLFVFLGSATGLTSSNTWMAEGNQASAHFGGNINPGVANNNGVASAGDVNGDGYSDVIVGGSFQYDNGQSDEGRAYVYLGSASGLAPSPLHGQQRVTNQPHGLVLM